MPKRFRDAMEKAEHLNWTITRGYGDYLCLYNRDQWERLTSYIKHLNPLDPRAQRLLRVIRGCALTSSVDRQGRLAVPQPLRELAGLSRDVMIVGMDDHLELWDKESWNKFQADIGPEISVLAAELLVSAGPAGTATVGGAPNDH